MEVLMEQEVKQIKNEQKENALAHMQKALSITRKEFVKYFEDVESKFGELECSMCKTSMWVVPSRDDDPDLMAVLTLPLPLSHGRGMWVYPVVCKECGFLAYFASSHVAAKIRGQ